jgi:hypothetical protein
VILVDTQDTKPMAWSKMEIADIQEKLANRLGTNAKGIEITNVSVNPASKNVYLTVRKLDDNKNVLLTVNSKGKIGEFVLEKVRFVAVKLPESDKGPVTLITDVTFAGDRILVTAQANETFGSKFVSIPYPLKDDKTALISTETYHVAHGKWETKAPIRVAIPYEEKGEKYLVGAFTCTPIVKYKIEDMKPAGTVKGQSVIELGNGNTPLDMFSYEKGGKKYILMNTKRKFKPQIGPTPFWTVRVDFDILAETQEINEKALRRVDKKYQPVTDRAVIVETFHGVTLMDKLDDTQAITVRTNEKGQLNLEVLALP